MRNHPATALSLTAFAALGAACALAPACWSDDRPARWDRPRDLLGPIALKAQVAYIDPALDRVVHALDSGKIAHKSSKLGYVPKSKKEVRGRDAEVCMNLAETLDDHDDVQTVYSDFDIPEDELTRILGA